MKNKNKELLLQLFKQNRTWTLTQLDSSLPNTDRSTIFRNIQKLLNENLITTAHIHNKETHFELLKASKHHDHLVCKVCNTTECIPCPAPKLQKHHLEIEDLCTNCKK